MRVAFGQEAGPPPELFLVGLATLTLVSLAAEEQPLLCTIDDAHWLDHESVRVLPFVARRLYADRVGIIAASNALVTSQVAEGLPAVIVDGLPDTEARDLLAVVAGGALTTQAADRILAEAGNNPLALVELGTAYPDDEASGRAAPLEPLPLGDRLREHFLRLVRGLPPDAQEFTLLAAADPEANRALLWRAAERAGSTRTRPRPTRRGRACSSSPATRSRSVTRCCGRRCTTARAPPSAGARTARWAKRTTRTCARGTWPRRRSPRTRSSRANCSAPPSARPPAAAARPGPSCCGGRPR